MMTLAMSTTALAGVWRTGLGLNENRWWYDDGNGTYAESEWRWLDGNQDGIAECYAFDGEGWMYANTTTPDGYQVNQDGAWIVNGIVQTCNLTVDLNRHHEVETRELYVDNNGADIYGVAHIKAETLFYPAFVAHDNAHSMYSSLDEVLESEWFNWLTLGKKYYEDVWNIM